MSDSTSEAAIGRQRRDQMLKLVSKGFYKELVNYGVQREEVLKVASHLLDNVMSKESQKQPGLDYYDDLFRVADVADHWSDEAIITLGDVSLKPLEREAVPKISDWLGKPGISGLFVPEYPGTPESLATVLIDAEQTEYLAVYCDDRFVGMIGGERIDRVNGRLEMKKLVGEPDVRGRGVGKRATFAYLFHAFRHLDMHKVFVHSRDINIRNINLNSKFGFVLEGMFLEELRVDDGYQDVVRMALFRSFWEEIFGG